MQNVWTYESGVSLLKNVNGLASAPNVQVVKTRKSECRFPQGLCSVLVLYNFQFIREEIKRGKRQIKGTRINSR